MKAVVLIFFGLLAATAVVTLVILYLRYASSPAAQWKRRVRAAVGEQEGRLRAARRELSGDRDGDDRGLRDEFLDRHLRTLAVDELARYPGIGPVTVSRLRDAGLATVGACVRVRLSSVPGIGPAREAGLKDALRKARREAESRFDAGACREAAAFAEEKQRRKADRQRRQQAAEAEVQSAEATLALLQDRTRIADGITYLGHLFGNEPPGLTDELIAAPLTAPPESPKPAPIPVGKPEPQPARKPPAAPPARPQPVEPEARREGEAGPAEPLAPAEHGVSPERERLEGPLRQARVASATSPVAHAPGSPDARPASPSRRASGSAVPTDLAPPPTEVSPLARLRTVAGLGLAVAKADGRIAAAERKQVRTFLERRYATDPELARKVESLIAEVEADLPTIGDALWEVKRALPTDTWPELYQFAVSVADAAGERNTREVECLARVAEALGIGVKPPPAHVPAPVIAAAPDSQLTEPECRAALDIAADIPLSVDLIWRQYRLLSDRFAPERFANHGSEFVQMAAEKREKSERAARHLLAGYNEPLEPPAAAPPPADLRHNPDLDDVFGA
jgi:uncharacterized tellurite resistance protein B-like protein